MIIEQSTVAMNSLVFKNHKLIRYQINIMIWSRKNSWRDVQSYHRLIKEDSTARSLPSVEMIFKLMKKIKGLGMN